MLKADQRSLPMAYSASQTACNASEKVPIEYRSLNLTDLEQYKQLLRDNEIGYIGFLFKDLCDNVGNAFYIEGAFDGEQLIGLIVGIRDFKSARPVPNCECALSSTREKLKLSYIVTVVVDKAYRHNKIGTTLLEHFTRNISTDHNQQVYTITPKNTALFFTGNKFKAVTTVESFYNDNDGGILVVKQSNSKFMDE